MVELVEIKPEYVTLWHQWRSEPSTVQHNPVMNDSLEALRERVAKMKSDLSDLTTAKVFLFFIKWNGQPVGAITVKDVSESMMYGEIGYGIGEKFQNQGIGSKAIAAFISRLFNETPLRRLFALVAENNIPSRKLLEKNGFVQEGILREHFIINGKPTSEVIYGLLKSEWRQR
jgi:RimJ/RimL family protein N-acetyltransferase